MANKNLTVFHITHWKAGSQWAAEILRQCAPKQFIGMKIENPHSMGGRGILSLYVNPVRRGKIYGTVYFTYGQFQSVILDPFAPTKEADDFYLYRAIGNWWNFKVMRIPHKSFVIIRDLRDTLVSLYFSTKYSHKIVTDQVAELRQKLNNSSEEDGLIHLLDHVMPGCKEIQTSWLNIPKVLFLRYKDILGNEHAFFEKIIDYCEINISRERLREIVDKNIFEAATGRKRGQEDVNAHMRKGIAGDWKNYFTDKVKEEFKKRYGETLVQTGYEKNLNW